jgi:hypothetical protein
MAIELKPCPFCGKTPTINRLDPEERIAGIACGEGPCDKTGLCICFVVDKEAEAIGQWNTRAMPECVRGYLNIASQWIGYQGKIETRAARESVLKYYGEGGE